jgi:hypothetical protein
MNLNYTYKYIPEEIFLTTNKQQITRCNNDDEKIIYTVSMQKGYRFRELA